MRLSIVRHIARKDVVELLRDRRTVVMAFVVPAIVYPLLFTIMGSVTADKKAELERTRARVAVWGPVPQAARDAVTSDARADVVDVRASPPSDVEREARAWVADKRAHVVLVTPADARGPSTPIRVLSDSTSIDSAVMEGRVTKALEARSAALLRARLSELGQDPASARPLDLKDEDLADGQRKAASFAAALLPYLLLVLVATSGFYAALDVTAGEKERGTLQTLLTAPVRSVEIVAGKFLAVLALTLAATAVNLGSIAFAIARGSLALGGGARFALGFGNAALVFATLLPAALLIVALLMGVGVMARTYKEGQSYLTPVLLLIIVTGFASMLPGAELTRTSALVPLVNVALLVHDLLLGKATAGLVTMVWLVSLAWATLGVLFAARVFQTEQVLLSGEKPWRDILTGRPTAGVATPGNAVLFSAMLLVVVFYASAAFDGRASVATLILGSQLVFFLLPSLGWMAALRQPVRETLQLRWPVGRAWLGTALLAAGGWSVGAVVWAWLQRFPGARAYGDMLGELLGKHGQLSLGVAVLLVGVVPGIVEEITFRGVILAGFRASGSRTIAIVGSAVVFGLFHFNPYHVTAAFVMGLVLATAAVESGSILPGILLHVVNNSLQMVAERTPALQAVLQRPTVLGAALAATALGLWLLRRERPVSAPVVAARSEVRA